MLLVIWYIFLASASVLFIYHLLAFFILIFHNKKSKSINEPVSVIVCTHYEFENLQALVPKLLEQQYDDFEIIIVDDRSGEDSYWYIRDLAAANNKVRHVRIDEAPGQINEKKYALTLGIKAAKNDILLFTDDDCLPVGDQWLANMVKPFSNPGIKVVLGFSTYERVKGLLNKLIRFETFRTALSYFVFAKLGNPYMGVGRNLAYRKSFFLEKEGFRGFQQVTGGDDDLFVNKNATKGNTAVVLNKEATTISKPKKTWGAYKVQRIRHMSVGKYYKFKDRFLLGVLYLGKLLFWLSLVPVIVSEFKPNVTAAGFVAVMVLFLVNYIILRKKLNDMRAAWNILLLDIVYIFYYLSVGLKVSFTKKVRWS